MWSTHDGLVSVCLTEYDMKMYCVEDARFWCRPEISKREGRVFLSSLDRGQAAVAPGSGSPCNVPSLLWLVAVVKRPIFAPAISFQESLKCSSV